MLVGSLDAVCVGDTVGSLDTLIGDTVVLPLEALTDGPPRVEEISVLVDLKHFVLEI